MKKIIIIIIILLLIPTIISAQNKGYKKLITIKEDGGLLRNPCFIDLTIEDDNLKKDDNVILIDSKTNKEVPIYIFEKVDKKIKFRFETILNKNEEKNFEFRFGTQEKSSETKAIDYIYPNFVGTEFYGISFEKIYIIGLKESDVKVINKDGKTLFDGKIKYGQYKRIDLTSPQIFNVKSSGPVIVTVSSIGLPNDNTPQDKSDDDLTYLIGSEGFFFTQKNIFIVSLTDSNSTQIEDAGGELIFKGNINKGEIVNKSVNSPSLIYYKSTSPLLIIYGVFNDSTFLPIVPYKGLFYSLTFGDLKIFSLEDDLNYKINLLSSKKFLDGQLKKYDYKTIESSFEPFEITYNKNLYLYLLGTSSNFGGEEILNKFGYPSNSDFTFLTGKISTKYSTGHKRVVYTLSLYDNNEVTIKDITLNKTNKITLQKMGVYQYETDNSLSEINITSKNDIIVFETSNHINREILYNISPVKDDSIIITLGKTEAITGEVKPPTDGTKPPINQRPTVETPKGIINIILWEFSLIKDRFVSFINNFTIVLPFIKNIKFENIKLPSFLEKINSYLPPFLQGINFILIIALIILLIILFFILSRRKRVTTKEKVEELEEIEIPGESLEPIIEKKEELKLEEKEVKEEGKIPIELKEEEIKEEETKKEELKLEEEKIEIEELMPKPNIITEPKLGEVIPKISKTERTVDTSIFKGRVVLDRKAIMKLLELDYFPFLEEAYITSKVANELPIKYRASEKIKSIELTRFEESMAEDLGKRVGGSKETGEALALALKLKIDKCIVGEKFNKVFQNINIYSYENFE
ncbi:MAG: hypothetical protein ACPLN1_02905 [Caldisericia bacterium]